MKTDFTIREAQQTDTIALKELFQNTVLAVNSKDYSQAEVEDWASCGDDLSNIEEMIKTHYFIVAVNQQSQIIGFSSITSQGYLHSMASTSHVVPFQATLSPALTPWAASALTMFHTSPFLLPVVGRSA